MLWALALGILAGITFGEAIAPLRIVATGFIRLLQVNVLPYLLGSLMASLGGRGTPELKLIARHGLNLLLIVWALALAFVVLAPLALPPSAGVPVFGLTDAEASVDWLDLYIPANLFHSLTNNLIPAVVLFGILAGVALGQMQGERKQTLLFTLEAFNEAMARISRMILRLTPIGLFAMVAVTAGELRIEDVVRLQVWLHFYAGGAVLLTFVLLPVLVTRLTGIPYRRFVTATRSAVITAAAAGDALVVLPLIMEAGRALLREDGAPAEDADRAIGVATPLLYNFPHAGKVLSLAFLPFAAWSAGALLSPAQIAQLSTAGLLSLFGSINGAVLFLLDLLQLPADLFTLFSVSGVLNSHLGAMAAAMHNATVSVLVGAGMLGRLHLSLRRVVRFGVMSLVVVLAFLASTRALFTWLLPPAPSGLATLSSFELRPPTVRVEMVTSEPPATPAPGRRLEQIMERRMLRVGYFADAMPWAFVNADGRLVGFDIEAAHRLAAALGVTLAFVPSTRPSAADDLSSGRIDIVMSGVVATVARAERMELSQPYSSEHVGFLARDHLRGRFGSFTALAGGDGLTIGIPAVEGARELVTSMAPLAVQRPIGDAEETILDPSVDATIMTLERAYYWSRVHPEFTAVRPEEVKMATITAYALPLGEPDLRNLVNVWIDTRRASGELDEAYDYWVRGRALAPRAPRWSLLRNVFGWGR